MKRKQVSERKVIVRMKNIFVARPLSESAKHFILCLRVFCLSLFLGFGAFFFFPISSSSANRIDINIDPTNTTPGLSLAISSDRVASRIEANYLSTSDLDIAVSTTSAAGYKLYVAAAGTDHSGNYTNALIHSNSGVNVEIPTLSSNVAATSFPDAHWGYTTSRLADGIYRPFPVYDTTDTTSHGGNIISESDTAVAEADPAGETTLTIGMKGDNALPAGSYENEILFTAVTEPVAITYNLFFNGNTDGNGNTVSPDLSLDHMPSPNPITTTSTDVYKIITIPNTIPTRTGYAFAGWAETTNPSNTDTIYQPNTQITLNVDDINTSQVVSKTLYATWTSNSHTVTVNKGANVSTVTGAGTYNYGATVNIAATAFTAGYHFSSWTVDSGGISAPSGASASFTMPASNVTVTANAAVNSFTLAYDANGGTGTTSSQTPTYNTVFTLRANGFTAPIGKHFKEWNTALDGTGTSYQSEQANVAPTALKPNLDTAHGGTVTLYAIWENNAGYAITYNANGGSFAGSTSTNTTVTEYNCESTTASISPKYSHTANISDAGVQSGNYANSLATKDVVSFSNITGVSKLSVTITYGTERNYDYLYVFQGAYTGSVTKNMSAGQQATYNSSTTGSNATVTIEVPGDTATFAFYSDSSQTYYGYYAVITPLDADGNTITNATITTCGYTNVSGTYQQPPTAPFESLNFKGWAASSSDTAVAYSTEGQILEYMRDNSISALTVYAVWSEFIYMQEFKCATDLTAGNIIQLADARDGSVYRVKKFSDNSCWMIQNLRLGYDKGYAMTNALTNIPDSDGSTYYIPRAGFQGDDVITTDSRESTTVANYSTIDDNRAKLRYEEASETGSVNPQDTSYYNFYTATLGFAYHNGGSSSGSSPRDICPKGWQLPVNASSNKKSWYYFYNTIMGGSHANMVSSTGGNFGYSGWYNGSIRAYVGSRGYWWQSTVSGSSYSYYFYLNSDGGVYPQNDGGARGLGFPVRCVFK